MWEYASYGVVLGLSAGLSPGPLLAIVITQTLQHGVGEGVKVAMAPVLTDLPIIGAALFLFSTFPGPEQVLGYISFVGAGFVFYLGVGSIRQKPIEKELTGVVPRSYLRGVLVNALSPHPYLFWFAVGVPTMIKASQDSSIASATFVICFFALIIGAKMAVALAVGRSSAFLSGSAYVWVMRVLGLCLMGFAALLLEDGLVYTGLWSND